MWYLQHRLFAQVVHLSWCIYMYGWRFGAQIKLALKSIQEKQRDQMSDQFICSFVRRGTDTMLSESQKKREERALLRTLPMFLFTPWPHRGGRRSRRLGPALAAPWSSSPICEGAAHSFSCLHFEILFENSINVADFSEPRQRRFEIPKMSVALVLFQVLTQVWALLNGAPSQPKSLHPKIFIKPGSRNWLTFGVQVRTWLPPWISPVCGWEHAQED